MRTHKTRRSGDETSKSFCKRSNEKINIFFHLLKADVSKGGCLSLFTKLWFRKCQPDVLYLNSNMSIERKRLLKPEEELLEMPENSIDI